MEFDFSKLDDLSQNATKRPRTNFRDITKANTLSNKLRTDRGQKQSEQGAQNPTRCKYIIDGRRRDRERAREVYREHQESIKRAGNLRINLIKGIKRGENPYSLLATALECIALITGDQVIYTQGKKDITAVYGYGLGEPQALQEARKEAQERLEHLRRANVPKGSQKNVQAAIRAHEDRIREIDQKMHKKEQEKARKKAQNEEEKQQKEARTKLVKT